MQQRSRRRSIAGRVRPEPPSIPPENRGEVGSARINDLGGTPSTDYYHTDMLGTTRFLTDASGARVAWFTRSVTMQELIEPAVYTAFGELVSGTSGRFGYVGAHGYQTSDEMPYQHVGNRYYDPTTGRFLQRDPMGLAGGLNAYSYTHGAPSAWIDPSGLEGVQGMAHAVWVQMGKPYYNPYEDQHQPKPKPVQNPSTESASSDGWWEIGSFFQSLYSHVKDILELSLECIKGVASHMRGVFPEVITPIKLLDPNDRSMTRGSRTTPQRRRSDGRQHLVCTRVCVVRGRERGAYSGTRHKKSVESWES